MDSKAEQPTEQSTESVGNTKGQSSKPKIFTYILDSLSAGIHFLAMLISTAALFVAKKIEKRFGITNSESQSKGLRVLKGALISISQFLRFSKLTDLPQTSTKFQAVMVCSLLFGGCFLGNSVFIQNPPGKVVKEAIARSVGSTTSLGGGQTSDDLAQYGYGNKLIKYRLTNHYTRKINDEKYHIYDYLAAVETLAGSETQEGTVYIVKRGSAWYSEE